MAPAHTKAHEFFDTHVVPNVEEWRKNPTDLRLAMSAALALNQMADHFWHAYGAIEPHRVFNFPSPGAFRAELASRHSHFALLRDVAEAHKHVRLDRLTRVVTSADQTSVGATGYGVGGFSTGPWSGGPSIVVELDNGEQRHLSAITDEAMRLWTSMLG